MLSRRLPKASEVLKVINVLKITIHTPVSPSPSYLARSYSSASESQANSKSPTSHSQPSTTLSEPSPSIPQTQRPSSAITLQYPDSPSPSHNDLPSYLLYATRTGLSLKSTIYVGTVYEYTVAGSLARLGFSLRRIGGRSDGGIDLLGTWSVPSLPDPHGAPLRVLCQCKAYVGTSKVGPQHVRELEGAFVAAPPGWRGVEAGPLHSSSPTSASSSPLAEKVAFGNGRTGGGVIGILISQKPATKGVRESLQRSRWPMAYMAVSKDGKVMQMLWNGRAEQEGLSGMGVGVQHTEQEGNRDEELVLTWQGLPYAADVLDGNEQQ